MRRLNLYAGILVLTILLGVACAGFMKQDTITERRSYDFKPAPTRSEETAVGRHAKQLMIAGEMAGGMMDVANVSAPMAPPVGSPIGQSGSPEAAPAETDRQVVYSADMVLRVAAREAARTAIEEIIRRRHGIIMVATLEDVTFRVPPAQFDAALAELAALGEVAAREVRSEDVTAQYRDLNLRIEVAEASRKRLMELLASAKQIKDVLEVERDIRRLTEEIEQLKGQLRQLADRVQLATIHVRLEEKAKPPRPPRPHAGSLFSWINAIGLDPALAPVDPDAPLKGRPWPLRWVLGQRFRLKVEGAGPLPGGFVPLQFSTDELIGATPEDWRLRVRFFEIRQKASLEFWAKALTTDLKDYRGFMIEADESFALEDARLKARVLRCRTQLAAEPWRYDVWLIQPTDTPHQLYVVEFARPEKAPESTLVMIERAVKGFKGD